MSCQMGLRCRSLYRTHDFKPLTQDTRHKTHDKTTLRQLKISNNLCSKYPTVPSIHIFQTGIYNKTKVNVVGKPGGYKLLRENERMEEKKGSLQSFLE